MNYSSIDVRRKWYQSTSPVQSKPLDWTDGLDWYVFITSPEPYLYPIIFQVAGKEQEAGRETDRKSSCCSQVHAVHNLDVVQTNFSVVLLVFL